VESLRRKVFRRIEPNPEWTETILEQNKRVADNESPATLQLPEGLTAANLFDNYIHVTAGRKGLVIKRHVTDPWYPLASLDFSERRIIFLGLTDHMYSTFDAILCTFRHLEELYTHGYPLNIKARMNAMFDLLRDKSRPYDKLSPQIRTMIYSKMHALSQAVDRFCYTFAQLSKITKEARNVMRDIRYVPKGYAEFIEDIAKERVHIQLVVPFTTLSLNGLTEIKLRGRGLPHEKPAVPDTIVEPLVGEIATEVVDAGN